MPLKLCHAFKFPGFVKCLYCFHFVGHCNNGREFTNNKVNFIFWSFIHSISYLMNFSQLWGLSEPRLKIKCTLILGIWINTIIFHHWLTKIITRKHSYHTLFNFFLFCPIVQHYHAHSDSLRVSVSHKYTFWSPSFCWCLPCEK